MYHIKDKAIRGRRTMVNHSNSVKSYQEVDKNNYHI